MKYLLFIAFISLTSFFAWGQQDINNGDPVLNALKRSSADAIANYFDEVIDLKIPQKGDSKGIGKKQAGIMLSSFYSEYGINEFSFSSQREMGASKYITGKISGTKGKSFNVTVMMKITHNTPVILSMRIN